METRASTNIHQFIMRRWETINKQDYQTCLSTYCAGIKIIEDALNKKIVEFDNWESISVAAANISQEYLIRVQILYCHYMLNKLTRTTQGKELSDKDKKILGITYYEQELSDRQTLLKEWMKAHS